MNSIKRQFNLRAIQPNIKTLELHHIIVKNDTFIDVGFNVEPGPEESKHFCVLGGIPFHLFERDLVYPNSYDIYDNLPFSKIKNEEELVSAIKNYGGDGMERYARYFDDEDLLNKMVKNINPDWVKVLATQDGMVVKIELNGVYAIINDTMVYISKDDEYHQLGLGSAQKSTL